MTDTDQDAPRFDPEPDVVSPDPTVPIGDGPFPGEPADHTAPYGRGEDGVLLDRDGLKAPYGLARSGKRKRNKPGGRAQRRPTGKPSPPSGRTIAGRRAKAVADLLELPAAGCIGLGLQRNDYRFIAQADTFQSHSVPLGKALAELAEDNARLAQVLDRATEGGPFFALGLVVVGFVAQTARNFGRLPGELAAMLGGKTDPIEAATAKLESLGIPVNIEAQGNGAAAPAA